MRRTAPDYLQIAPGLRRTAPGLSAGLLPDCAGLSAGLPPDCVGLLPNRTGFDRQTDAYLDSAAMEHL